MAEPPKGERVAVEDAHAAQRIAKVAAEDAFVLPEQEVTLHSGRRVHGALDAGGLEAFVREHDIRLLVDAAHPFAAALHANAAQAAARMGLPIIRYERIYPPRKCRSP